MKYIAILIITILSGCNLTKPPKEKLSPYLLGTSYEFINDKLKLQLNNTLKCPMRIWVQPIDEQLKAYFDQINPITLAPLTDTTIRIAVDPIESKEIGFASRFGDIYEEVKVRKVELPFQKNRTYRLIQGYKSTPTHNTDWSRYAFDFGLAIGDTVCSATSGYVVGLVEDYRYGGKKKEWRDYANSITIYDPGTGLYTQYVHLNFKGSLVKLGDRIEKGQKIGISGKTGFINVEHLHFNCLKPVHSNDGLLSIPLDSIGQYKVSEMKRNQMIKN